jgi:hypothetical protein
MKTEGVFIPSPTHPSNLASHPPVVITAVIFASVSHSQAVYSNSPYFQGKYFFLGGADDWLNNPNVYNTQTHHSNKYGGALAQRDVTDLLF